MDDFQRIPPHDIEAETVVIGSMVLREAVIPKVARVLVEDDFYRPPHVLIFRTMLEMVDDGRAVDFVTLKNALVRNKILESVGGIEYVVDVAEGVPNAENWPYYASIVLEMSRRRDMIQKAADAIRMCYDRSSDLDGALTQLSDDVYQNAHRSERESRGSSSLSQAMRDAADHADAVRDNDVPPGLQFGLAGIDQLTGGMRPGELIVIGGRTGGGKTSLATGVALHAASEGEPVILFSREMQPKAIGKRSLQVQTQIRGNALKFGEHTAADSQLMNEAIHKTSGWKFHVDSVASTAGEIGATVRQKAREWGGVGLVVVDYLQLLSGKGDTRAQEIGRLAWAMKELAMDWSCPVIALSQFARTQNSGKFPPGLQNLKESGDIENNADMALLLWYSDLEDPSGDNRRVWAQIAKQRDGCQTFWPTCADSRNQAVAPVGKSSDGCLYLWLHLPTTTVTYALAAEQEF